MENYQRDLLLKEKYPKILKNLGGSPQETCMSWEHGGIAIGDGWLPLLEKVFAFCQFNHDKNGYPQLVADQVKEKFGTLRFYYHFEECDSENAVWGTKYNRTDEYLEGAIEFATHLTAEICEYCGKPSKVHGKHWRTTECKDCENERKISEKQMSLFTM